MLASGRHSLARWTPAVCLTAGLAAEFRAPQMETFGQPGGAGSGDPRPTSSIDDWGFRPWIWAVVYRKAVHSSSKSSRGRGGAGFEPLGCAEGWAVMSSGTRLSWGISSSMATFQVT